MGHGKVKIQGEHYASSNYELGVRNRLTNPDMLNSIYKRLIKQEQNDNIRFLVFGQ